MAPADDAEPGASPADASPVAGRMALAATGTWLAGVGTLALYGLLVAPQAPVGGPLVVAGLAVAAGVAPFLPRLLPKLRGRPLLEAGLVPLAVLLVVLPLHMRPLVPRAAVVAGAGLAVVGYFLHKFTSRLARARAEGGVDAGRDAQDPAGDGSIGTAWRFAATRITVVVAIAAALALAVSEAPRLVGPWISARWPASVDAVSVQAVGLAAVAFLAVGTGVTLVRLGRVAGKGSEAD